ncbi:hypothetical protein DYI95_010025 [Thermaerobacter sp. PB12/4term]|uniref:hypothetical protein n=1 Tax=Thermaerobacter sp. PB12/4term TaxID=2293838 RepID=UPI000E328F84|nr:hypothetical protein [Thermaerobacter sp. PB12/4term]QIA27802.1 hypothetical protein DYI95_010025 [Thermaerobacter sp. PB12/4term]
MPQMAQHQAAELWELCRDHAVAGAKLRALAGSCQDSTLRQTLERHAGEFQQAAQRLMGFLQEQGGYGTYGRYGQDGQQGQAGSWQWPAAAWQSPYQAQWQAGGDATWQSQPQAHGTNQVYGAAGIQGQPLDIALASDCLRTCKTFAVQCIWGATECAEPARSYLYQLAGEHLRMAMDHYRWLEQHQVYASPHIDQHAVQEYTQKLHQLMQVGQAVAAQGLVPAQRGFATAGAGMHQAAHGGAGAYGTHGQGGFAPGFQAPYGQQAYGQQAYGHQAGHAGSHEAYAQRAYART